jgi:serine/threonine-protein kinase RsbW
MAPVRKLTVAGYFKNLARIANFVSKVAAEAGLDDKAAYATQMAVDEACTNIIEHAYGIEGAGAIELTCRIQEDGLQVTITDQGRPFAPDQLPRFDPQAPLSERSRRGMGVFFIQNLMDRVEYKFSASHGNRLIMFKRKEQV